MSINPTPNAHDGEYLYNLWRSSGLSQRDLAKQLGMSFNELHGLIWRYQLEQGNIKGNQNEITVSTTVNRVKSLDDLIEALGIDQDEWQLSEYRVHKYDAYRKDVKKELVFNDGKVSGEVVDEGDLTIEEMYSVQAKFIRRHPEPLQPVIQPIQIKPSERWILDAEPSEQSCLFLSDLHIGFLRDMDSGKLEPIHDRRAISTIFSVLADQSFDQIVLGGDILDLAEWSDKYIREPEFYFTTQPALIEASWIIGKIRSLAPKAKITILAGNHEDRIRKALLTHLASAYNVKINGKHWHSLTNLLGLQPLGVQEEKEVWIGETRVIHGDIAKNKSGQTVVSAIDNYDTSIVFGHVHRMETAWKTVWRRTPKLIYAVSSGCLCRLDGVVPAVKKENNWQQGFLVIRQNGELPIHVPIMDGKAYLDNTIYNGIDYVEMLCKETSYNF